MRFMLSPSLLACDMAHFADEVRRVEAAGADLIHVDVMDGHFVPNITLGPVVVKALKRCAARPLDVHIMIDNPEQYADPFVDAGAGLLTFHHEATDAPRALADRIRARGARPAVSVKPKTPIEVVFPYLDALDMVLIMTVEPGFGGQAIIPECLDKVAALREEAGPDFDIEVDGGIDVGTIGDAVRAGANVFVAGSAIFGSDDIAATMRAMRQQIEQNAPSVV